jgi:hypothetical protein
MEVSHWVKCMTVYLNVYAAFCPPGIGCEDKYHFFTLLTAFIYDLRIVFVNSGMALTIS